MREILFRGKRIDNGEWLEGQYAYLLNLRTEDGEPIKHMILDGTPFGQRIEISTVGQFTGLTDKNGKKIFEGDLLRLTCSEYPSAEELFSVWFGPYKITEEDDYDCVVGWYTQGEGKSKQCGVHSLFADVERANMYYEVIGNIHDNPELLEED